MANTELDSIPLGDRANRKQGIFFIPAKAEADKPGLLNLQSVSGTTVSDRWLWMSSSGTLRYGATRPTAPDTDGSAVGTTASSLGASTPISGTGAYDYTLVATTLTSGAANLTIPDVAGVNQVFTFNALAQTLTNKTMSGASNTFTSLPAANLLIASQATGDILYASNATTWARLGTGTAGYVLTAGGAGAAPSWQLNTVSTLPQTAYIDGGTYDLTISTTTQTSAISVLTIPDFAGVNDTFAFVTKSATLVNKTLTDTTCIFGANGALTKTLGFDLSALTAGNKLTLAAAAGTAQTLTLPNATDTLVGKATTDTFTNKTLTDTTCIFGANGALTKTLGFDLSALTAGNKVTLAAAAGTACTVTIPNATDTLVGKATSDVFTNKTYNAAGTGNVLSNVGPSHFATTAATNGLVATPIVIVAVNTGAATTSVFNANCPYKIRIIGVEALATKACSGTWKLYDGSADITGTVSYGTDQAVTRVGTIDDSKHEIAANGTLQVISSDGTDTAILYIYALKITP